MTGPSPHLSWKELACHDGAPYPTKWRKTRGKLLGQIFEVIRAMAGDLPIRVTSAYRTPTHNRAVGGVKTSQHIQGLALDLNPPKGMSIRKFHTIIREIAQWQRDQPIKVRLIGGLGFYPYAKTPFVHVDLRVSPTGRLAAWSGGRKRANA